MQSLRSHSLALSARWSCSLRGLLLVGCVLVAPLLPWSTAEAGGTSVRIGASVGRGHGHHGDRGHRNYSPRPYRSHHRDYDGHHRARRVRYWVSGYWQYGCWRPGHWAWREYGHGRSRGHGHRY